MNNQNIKGTHSLFRSFGILLLAALIFAFNSATSFSLFAQTDENAITFANLLREHNIERANLGLTPLKLNTALTNSAGLKAQAMLDSDCWSHYCPDGKSPWEFFSEAGYVYVLAGENLGEGFYDVKSIMTAWLNSPTHRANIIKPEYQEIGFGIVAGSFQNNSNNIIVAVHFGTRSEFISNTVSERAISITKPLKGTVVGTPEIKIEGKAVGASNVEIINNDILDGSANILDGIFTYNLDNLSIGSNVINAKGYWDEGTVLISDSVSVQFQPAGSAPALTISEPNLPGGLSGSTGKFIISMETRNLVNLGVIAFVALLFFLDFAVLSKTKILIPGRSFSHYHFVLFIVVAGLIFIGGFAGRIGSGIFS